VRGWAQLGPRTDWTGALIRWGQGCPTSHEPPAPFAAAPVRRLHVPPPTHTRNRSYSDGGLLPLGLPRAASRGQGSFVSGQPPLSSFLSRIGSRLSSSALNRHRRDSAAAAAGPGPEDAAGTPDGAEHAPSAAARRRGGGGPRFATLSIDEDPEDEEAAWWESKERAAREAAAEEASGADRPWWEFRTGDPLIDRHITRVDVEGGMAWTEGKEGEPDGGAARRGRASGAGGHGRLRC
jgi:hypothetical protein